MPSIASIVLDRRGVALRAGVATIGLLVVPAVGTAQVSRPCLAPDVTSATVSSLAVQTVSDTASNVVAFRSKYGIPSGTAADVVVVQDNAICEAATAAMDSIATPALEAHHVVRMGDGNPFYLLAKRRSWGVGDIYLLNAQLALLVVM